MRRRTAILSVVFVVFGLGIVFGGGEITARRYMDESAAQAGTTLRLAVLALEGHLKRYEALPALIADRRWSRNWSRGRMTSN